MSSLESRFRVVLTRAPRGLRLAEDPPVVVLSGASLASAQSLRDQLREQGGAAIILDEAVVCDRHSDLLRAPCTRCGAPMCSSCALESGSTELCRACVAERHEKKRRVNTRQLFMLFLFSVFLFEVNALRQADRRLRTDGNPIHVALVQLTPPGTLNHPLLRALSGQTEVAGYQDVVRLFNREKARYTGNSIPALRLSVRGPWQERPRPPAITGEGLLLAWSSWRYARFWKRLGKTHGVDPEAHPLCLYVVFTGAPGDQASGSVASAEARFGVAYISLDEGSTTYPLLTIAHELAHLLGATDKYDERSLATFPDGYADPYRRPLYPQRLAELMAVDIPVGPEQEVEPASLAQVRLGYRTAAELGWISQEEADSYYELPALTPHDLLYGEE